MSVTRREAVAGLTAGAFSVLAGMGGTARSASPPLSTAPTKEFPSTVPLLIGKVIEDARVLMGSGREVTLLLTQDGKIAIDPSSVRVFRRPLPGHFEIGKGTEWPSVINVKIAHEASENFFSH
jgi:hypothetical protein